MSVCLFQIGAYDKQLWEKSVEERVLKVSVKLVISKATKNHIMIESTAHR